MTQLEPKFSIQISQEQLRRYAEQAALYGYALEKLGYGPKLPWYKRIWRKVR